MTDLVTIISGGMGETLHVNKIIEGEEWEKIFVICTEQSKADVLKKENIEIITIDKNKLLKDMIQDIKNKLNGKLHIMDTAVNIISGGGKEHMALLCSLLSMGVGIRFVAYTKEGVCEV